MFGHTCSRGCKIMIKTILTASIIITGVTFAPLNISEADAKRCNIVGNYNWKRSDKKLTANLCKLTKRFGAVHVNGSHFGNCRSRKTNKSVKRSYHLFSRGCKAADIWIKGVSGRTILNWWGENVGGGRGSYRCRKFVHVDVGPNRKWHWNTRCR